MKPAIFCGDTLARIRGFPAIARRNSGFQIDSLQRGLPPDDWKPLKTVGPGVREIRIKVFGGEFRVIYFLRSPCEIYVLHAFEKKSRKTRKTDIDLARKRFKELKQK